MNSIDGPRVETLRVVARYRRPARSLLALAFAMLLPGVVVAASAFAECPVTVSVSRVDATNVKVTADGGGGCGVSRLDVYLRDPMQQETTIGSAVCNTPDCFGQPLHFEKTIGTECKLSGDYSVRATAQCLDVGADAACNVAVSSGSPGGGYRVDSKPVVSSFVVGAPDAFGASSLIGAWQFPPEAGPDRVVQILTRRQGNSTWGVTTEVVDGTSTGREWIRNYSCNVGTYEFQLVASACFRYGVTQPSPNHQDVEATTQNFDYPPDVTLASDDSTGRLSVSWNFPVAPGVLNQNIWIYRNEVLYKYLYASGATGTQQYDLGCLPEGTYQFRAHAVRCGGTTDGEFPDGKEDFDNLSVVMVHKPTVSVATTPESPKRATATYGFPNVKGPHRVTMAYWGQSGPLASAIGSWSNLPQSGTIGPVNLNPPATARFVRATAVACDGSADVSMHPLEQACENCAIDDGMSACSFGRPITTSSGNMRYVEHDPVAGASEFGFRRTYDSMNTSAGVFGTGWTSQFDSILAVETLESKQFVGILLESNQHVFFYGKDSSFVQVWPEGERSTGQLARLGTDWIYTDPSSSVRRTFNGSTGRLTRTTAIPSGRSFDFTYDANGLPVSLTDSWGTISWAIATDATSRRVTSISIPGEDIVWSFQYTGASLSAVIAPGGGTWRSYVTVGTDLTEIRDALGNLIEKHTFDAQHRAISESSATRDISNIRYHLAGTNGAVLTEVTYANGAMTRYGVTSIAGRHRTLDVDGGCASCGTNDAVWAYDGSGHVTREQNARGYISEYSWVDGSLRGRSGPLRPAGCDPSTDPLRCHQTSASLASVTLEPTAATHSTNYTYADPLWPSKPTTVTRSSLLVAGGWATETFSYDPVTGALLAHTRNGWTGEPARLESRTTTTTLYDGLEGAAFDPGGAFEATWLVLSQPLGFRKSTDGPRTDVNDQSLVVYYPIDASVPAAWRGRTAAVRNAAGHTTRYENYDLFGNPRTVVDPNGVETVSTHDALGRLLTTTTKGVAGCALAEDPLCETDLVATRSYSAAGGPLASETRPGGGTTVYGYDGRGRVATVSRGPDLGDLRERIEYTYDPATGQKSMERILGFEGGTWLETKRESFAYDLFSRLSTATHADSTSVGYTYDGAGNLLSVRDENHATANTRYAYDPASRLVEVRQTLGSGEAVTSYAYDDEGNLRSVEDPNGNVTSYVYDDFGPMLRQTSAVTGVTRHEFDLGGNLARTVDARGAVTTRTYDAIGRVLQAVAEAGGSSETVVWGYDAGPFGIGRMTSMTDPVGMAEYAYDRRGLLLEESRSIEGSAYLARHRYDADGNRSSTALPSGRVVETTFDFAGRPLTSSGTIGGTPVTYVSGATYAPFGPMTTLTYGNGLTRTATLDARYRIDQLTLDGVAAYDYGYDGAGNVTSIVDLGDEAYNRSYGYDDLNRLVSAGTGAGLWGAGSYGYDAMGNMTSAQIGTRTASFGYAGTTPKLSGVVENGVSIPVAYDAAGNELTGTRSNAPGGASEQRWYTARNSLHLVYLGEAGAQPRPCEAGESCPSPTGSDSYFEFGYDGRGVRAVQRYRTASASVASHHLYTPELSLAARRDVTAGGGVELIWFAGAPVAQEAWGTPGETKWTFTDHLGTPLLQTNSSKAVVWRAEYEPYGNVWVMRNGTKDDQPLRFPGQERLFDGSTGTEERYNIFRWYRSGWGRYSQSDPIDIAGGMNLFRYAAASPLAFVDPLGLKVCRCDRRLDHWTFAGANRLDWIGWNWVHHSFVQIVPDGHPCGGYDGVSWGFQGVGGGLGRVEPERSPAFNPLFRCREIGCIDETRLRQYINQDTKKTNMSYEAVCPHGGAWNAKNCQGWLDDLLEKSKLPGCCSATPPSQPAPSSPTPTAPRNCAVVNGQTICAGTGI